MGLFTGGARAQPETFSGNQLLPGCKAVADAIVVQKWADAAEWGECVGMLKTLGLYHGVLALPYRFCPPDQGASIQQMAKIVVRYADAHPEVLHEAMANIAVRALAEGWPCRQRR
jgi:hypothetical protein